MNKQRILVVEDEEMVADIINRRLTARNYEVVYIADGELAWDLLSRETERFDCILLDRQLPGIDGMELLRLIKASPTLKHIPVVMETGLKDAASIREGMAEGAYYYLTKPLRQDLLVAIVEAAIGDHHERIAMRETRQQA
ncbi:MAG: response regulator, partial [Deltaproteobacteria bacterium]|nr:response regulator [Deltaproteobacteria bacterium]